MAVVLQLTAASSNLRAYLDSYDANFTYNGNGWFNGIAGGEDQWVAGTSTYIGTPTNGELSAIMDIVDYSYTPGAFNGQVTQLALGVNLVQDYNNDIFTQTNQLIITPESGYLPITSTFNEAIYALSHGGAVDGGTYTFTIPGQAPITQEFAGLTDYFAEQGTIQIGNVGLNDVLVGFGGQDTFVFQEGSGTEDTVNNFDVAQDLLDVSAWGATSLTDLNIAVDAGDTIIYSADFSDGIVVTGVTDLTVSNFVFADSLALAA